MTRYKTSVAMVDSDTGGINFDGLTTDGTGAGKLTIPSGGAISLASGASLALASGVNQPVASGASLSLANGATEVVASGASISFVSGANLGGTVNVPSGASLSLANGAIEAIASGASISFVSGANLGGTVNVPSGASLSLANGALEVVASGASLSLNNTALETFASGATMSMALGAIMQANGNIGFGAPGTTSVSVATASGTTVPIAQAIVRVSNTAASTSGSCTLAAGAFDGQCVTVVNEGGANFVVTGNMKANQTLAASSAMDLVWISTDTAWWRVN